MTAILNNPGYFITIDGLVYSNKRGYIKLLTRHKNHKGYLRITLYKKTIPIHRLVAITFIPNPNGFPQVNHIDGNKLNNNVSNLEWCTNEHNISEGKRLKLFKPNLKNHARGSKTGGAKLNENQVLTIREKFKSGVSTLKLCDIFRVSKNAIYSIINRETWKHV